MDLQAKKLSIISYLSQIQDESFIDKIEKLIKKERKLKYEEKLEPMSLGELESKLKKSREDIQDGRYFGHEEVGDILKRKFSSK